MDLLQSVRKEGSRGGRANFSWEDVKSDSHRENYLGHSLMAPVGRWQKNKDLSWYARGSGESGGKLSAEEERKEEIRRVKEAEEDALARALGYDVPERKGAGNANLTALGPGRDVTQRVKESVDEEFEGHEGGGGGKGLGFRGFSGAVEPGAGDDNDDVLEGTRVAAAPRRAPDSKRREGLHRHGRDDDERRRRRRDDGDSHRKKRRARSRSRSRERDADRSQRDRARRRSRSHSRERRGDRAVERHSRREDWRRPREDSRERYDRHAHMPQHRYRSRSPDEARRRERRSYKRDE